MRIHRFEFGLSIDFDGKPVNCGFQRYEGSCFCRILEVGHFYFTWLSYECMASIYKRKGREYRAKRYLKDRKKRTNL